MTNQQIYGASTAALKLRLTYLPITSIRTNKFVAYERKVITVELSWREAELTDSLRDGMVYSGLCEDFRDEPSTYETLNGDYR